jgi:hypothetical protein
MNKIIIKHKYIVRRQQPTRSLNQLLRFLKNKKRNKSFAGLYRSNIDHHASIYSATTYG